MFAVSASADRPDIWRSVTDGGDSAVAQRAISAVLHANGRSVPGQRCVQTRLFCRAWRMPEDQRLVRCHCSPGRARSGCVASLNGNPADPRSIRCRDPGLSWRRRVPQVEARATRRAKAGRLRAIGARPLVAGERSKAHDISRISGNAERLMPNSSPPSFPTALTTPSRL
jgi:hypothetical protein